MTGKQLIFVAVRFVGVLVLVQALVAASQFIAALGSIAWHPWSWWIGLLISIWILASVLMVAFPKGAARKIAAERLPSDQLIDWDQRVIEGIGLRLLGLYLLVQAAAETAHIGLYQVALQMYLRGSASVWVEPSPSGMISAASASIKTGAGAYLIVGTQRVRDAIHWVRTAGRDWEFDELDKGDTRRAPPSTKGQPEQE
jgi:hypothetical protein